MQILKLSKGDVFIAKKAILHSPQAPSLCSFDEKKKDELSFQFLTKHMV